MPDKKFSILTASYDNAIYLDDWMKSILDQSYRPLEVVFVNDHCEDNTEQKVNDLIVPALKANGIEFKYVRNKHRCYYGSASKIAYENATGEMFGVLDSDDMLVKDAVNFIVDLYNQHENTGYIYTQFNACNCYMDAPKIGFSRKPDRNETLLGLGLRYIHAYSHWRTFSSRCPNLTTIWKDGLRAAVDKYMGYRLEELAPGLFVNRVCYLLRTGVRTSITRTERSNVYWKQILVEAMKRRRDKRVKVFAVGEHKL
jgi:glycosyltransferase involved in cell wall biosynthesis